MRSVHEAEKATNVVDRVVRRGAVSAHRRIAHAFDLLIQAHDRVTQANDALKAALILYATAPEAVFPFVLCCLSDRIVDADEEIAAMSGRLAAASDEVMELAEDGVGPKPKIEPPSRPVPPRLTLVRKPVDVAGRIEALRKRRRRSRAAAPEDVPRKLSRGRAPPSLQACSL